jgi:hypothetical protein
VAFSAVSQSVHAALLGNNIQISGPGGRFPDVAFNSVDGKYLVAWPDYNALRITGRFVTATGAVSGTPFPISDAGFGALYPALAYNAAGNEFLVTWDDAGDRGGVIFGQRVRGSDGALMGTNFVIGTRYGGIRSAVAWSPVSSTYLAVYWGPGPEIDIYGQRVSGNGALLGPNFNISNDAIFSGYPAVTWGASGNQFLVTWDNEDGNIHGRRVDPATGALLGSRIIVTTGGGKDRSCIAYDSVNNRWLVQFNNGANAGFSYDQYGQLVNADGTLSGGMIPLAHTPAFEGDTQFGGDVAFVPNARRFYSSFGTDTGMGGQESFSNGAPVGPQVVLGSGYFTSLNNAADPQRNRFLTAWEGYVGGSWQVFGQLCAASIHPPSDFTATGRDGQASLAWRNPDDGHFTGTLIRVRTDRYPTGPDDGALVVDRNMPPSVNETFVQMPLANWTTYYYAAFAHDVGPNYSLAAQVAATPRPATSEIDSSTFTGGVGGEWFFSTWAAGALSPGTVSIDAVAGNVVATGSGTSNNRDACTREGSTLMRRISTAGWTNIQVEYDVMAALHVPPGGNASGACALLDGSDEDKLVVSYSASGTNGPWSTAQVLNEGVEFPTGWTRKLVNLAGLSAVNNNPNFALRFQWQFNSANDTGRIDNVRVLSGAVRAPGPVLQVTPARLEHTVQAGQNYRGDVLRVNNSGEGTANFALTASVPWLSFVPAGSSSSGPEQRVLIFYNTAALSIGDHDAVIQVTSTNATNSPQTIAVKLHVIPSACFWEPFDYYEGNLTLMGGANWSGNATNQLVVEDGSLRIVGGGGLVSATHTVGCPGSNGLIAAEIKIRKGAGSGDFFWNIAIDDPAGNNLARWYGGSTIARGRVGNNITADIPLTSADTWDDLFVKLDTAANTSEFFVNGVSVGTISHGTTPANTVGSVRIERLDRSSAAGDDIRFDSLTVGAVDPTPPRLEVTRLGNQVALSWPAVGMGASLQSISALATSNPWTAITNSIVTTNGRKTFVEAATNPATFYRLRR